MAPGNRGHWRLALRANLQLGANELILICAKEES
jgi:hypothetical protein